MRSTFWNYDATHRLSSITADAVEGNAIAKKLAGFAYETAVPYRLAATLDERGITTTYNYDNFDRVTRIGYFDSSQELFTYCSVCGALLTQTGRDGKTTTFVPDAMGRTTQVNYPDGRTVQMVYSPDGLLKKLTDAGGRYTIWNYDDVGRLSSKVLPNGYTKTYSWELGHIALERLPFQAGDASPPRFIRYNYWKGSLTWIDAVTPNPNAGYDEIGGPYKGFVYDLNGRVNSSLASLDQLNPIARNDTTYDVLGRVVAEDQQLPGVPGDEGAVVRTGYNAAGDVSGQSITNRAGTLRDGYSQTFSFDSLGRIVNNNTPVGRFTSGYNAGDFSDLQATITWPGTSGRTDFGYDGFGRSTSVVYRRSDLSSVFAQYYPVYDGGTLNNDVRTARDVITGVGRQLRDPDEVLDGGENISYGYEADADRLISETGSGNNSTLSNRFSYDAPDNRLSIWQPLQNRRTNYALQNYVNQITTAKTYATDGNGNPTSSTPLVQNAFDYDERGNLIQIRPPSNFYAPSVSYEYDLLNRLTAVVTYVQSTDTTQPGPKPMQRVEFTYDQHDRRVETDELTGAPVWGRDYNPQTQTYGDYYWKPVWTANKNTRTIYSGMTPIQERNGLVTQVQLYWGDNGLMARRVKNGTGWRDYFVTSDGFGSVQQIIRADTGTVVARYNYDAYGNITKQNGIAAPADALDQEQVNQPYRFQSHYFDKTSGLTDFGFRFYSSGTGRFINQDPLEEDGGINLYGFVNGNPTNEVDEDGLVPVMPDRIVCRDVDTGWVVQHDYPSAAAHGDHLHLEKGRLKISINGKGEPINAVGRAAWNRLKKSERKVAERFLEENATKIRTASQDLKAWVAFKRASAVRRAFIRSGSVRRGLGAAAEGVSRWEGFGRFLGRAGSFLGDIGGSPLWGPYYLPDGGFGMIGGRRLKPQRA